jgi:integrase
MLGAILQFAVNRGMRPDNPVRGVRRYPDQKQNRFLSAAELARLGDVLKGAEQDTNPSAIAAIRLLILTGCRKAEIVTMRWEYIDWEHACLRLPDSKTGAKVVHLGAPARALLEDLPRLKGNPYVLPGANPGDYFKGLQKVWVSLRARANLQDVRLHDLRHSFASVGAASGDSLLVIGALLGHKNAATTQRYAHLSNDPLRDAADKIARHIDALMNASQDDEAGGEVVPIRG